jgi:hypothetical protein
MEKKTKSTALVAALWALAALLVLTAATYAWFSFAPYVNATPMNGLVSGGDGSLLISNKYDGEYGMQCDLILTNSLPELRPVSTATLDLFYTAGEQTSAGIVTRFYPLVQTIDEVAMHGTVYLKSQDAAHNVYFDRLNMTFGEDIQAHAAMRLGMKISTSKGTDTYIFRLDELIDTYSAEVRRTIPEGNMVIASADAMGVPYYYPDPCVNLLDYCIQTAGDQNSGGAKALCNIPTNEIATVEYWLYLEGCDDNCINAVQMRDVALQFAFTGVITDAGAAQTAQTTQP